jgi:putative tricarboxylic transport membrane protein
MTRPLHKNGDLVSGAVLTGLGIFIVSEARGWDYMTPDGPGPGFFPMWYGIALVALSIPLMLRSVSQRAQTAEGVTDWAGIGRALIAWLALTVSIGLLKFLGFLVSFALLTFFIVTLMYRRPLLYGVVAGVAASVLFYLIFPLALNVELPPGPFGF